MTNPPLWKASVPLKKSEAADVVALFEITPPVPQAVLTAEEPFKDECTVEALYDVLPDGELLSKLAGREVRVIILPDADWIKLSQEGLPPVRAGRFFVYGAHDAGQVPPGVIPIRIEAGLAFGTGHHETTALCLAALSDLAKRRAYRNVFDLGHPSARIEKKFTAKIELVENNHRCGAALPRCGQITFNATRAEIVVHANDKKHRIDVGGHNLLARGSSSGLARELAAPRQNCLNQCVAISLGQAERDPVANRGQLSGQHGLMTQAPGNLRLHLSCICNNVEDVVMLRRNASCDKAGAGMLGEFGRERIVPAQEGELHF